MNFRQFLIANTTKLYKPPIICNDGFTFSVQASSMHYCKPKEDYRRLYTRVEIGYPSELDDLIKRFAESKFTTETVFPYVPSYIVQQLITKHKGINVKLTFNQ